MKPIINDVPAFDKNIGVTGTFITGGQIYSHTVIIKDINAEEIIYQCASQPGNRLNRFTIPAFADNTLENGQSYLLYIRTYENENSVKYFESDPKIIRCASIPSFQLNIYSGESVHYILKSTSLNVGVDYIQSEQEPLNEFYVVVKDSDDKEIFKSDLIYNISENVEINDLENYNSYTVCAYGKTLNGMVISTDDVIVDVDYIGCNDSSVLSVENDKCNARVILNSHIKNILYRLDKPPIYNPQLDLTDNILEYYDGVDVDGDFSMFIKFSPTEFNNTVFNINNGEVWLNFRTTQSSENFYEPYFEFYTKNGNNDIFTKMIIVEKNEFGNNFSQIDTNTYPLDSYNYDIKLSRENNIFEIKIKDWRE